RRTFFFALLVSQRARRDDRRVTVGPACGKRAFARLDCLPIILAAAARTPLYTPMRICPPFFSRPARRNAKGPLLDHEPPVSRRSLCRAVSATGPGAPRTG